MDLSIIIPVFNEVKLLPKILFKIIRDTKKINKEIIIVDDCSNDGTREWLKNISKRFNNIIIKIKLKYLKYLEHWTEILQNYNFSLKFE